MSLDIHYDGHILIDGLRDESNQAEFVGQWRKFLTIGGIIVHRLNRESCDKAKLEWEMMQA